MQILQVFTNLEMSTFVTCSRVRPESTASLWPCFEQQRLERVRFLVVSKESKHTNTTVGLVTVSLVSWTEEISL